jgi:hippurate hydrolase
MTVLPNLAVAHDEMTAWRRDLHAHPEIAFEERRTADVVARELERFGIAIDRGLARTGVVGTLAAGTGGRAIALRADMDALPLQEANDFAHASRHQGKMHACGHDGHTAMLLGAAKHLAATRNFDGIVHFIFQPAEENEGGARVMLEEGLFRRCPVSAVYGMHNVPGMPVGTFAAKAGPMMAAFDVFEITVRGKGSHAALPHQGIDPIVVASHVVTALQSIASRNVDPLDAVVVSVTQIHAGEAWNIVPDSAVLRGTCRTFTPALHASMESRLAKVAGGVCAAFGATMEMRYEKRYPPTVNTETETAAAVRAAEALVGADHVNKRPVPMMGSEDFAFMLQAKPGCYIWIGNGDGEGNCMLHNPRYDFNDAILPLGASYWVRLVEQELART